MKVVEVHDGDTVSVHLDNTVEKVRLSGIDEPEIGQRPWGLIAKKHLRELLDNSEWTVFLEFDVQRRDKYGRLLSYVNTPDGKMINIQMLKDGYAMLYTIPPNIRYADELRKAQYEAKEKCIGIWCSKGPQETPQEYRKEHLHL